MGGKSGPSNNQMVQFEMQQAQEAKDKENLRQARLSQGKSAIDQLFGNVNFDGRFYDKYKQANLDYSLPQLQNQYEKAKTGLDYDLARAGTLRSTMAGYAQGDLLKQNAVNEAGIRAKADTDTAALRQSIASQQNQAYNQLYATEDPGVAANTAATSVAGAQLSQPNLQPLNAVFTPVAIGLGTALSAPYGQYSANQMVSKSPLGQGAQTTSQQT
jgi:microcystin-dependent protein